MKNEAISLVGRCAELISKTALGVGISGRARSSHCVTRRIVAPGSSALTTTMKNTMLNTRSPPGTPASTGNAPRMIGTAPRRPIQPM